MPTTLDQILATTRRRLADAKSRVDIRVLEQKATLRTPRGFAQAVRVAAANRMAVIAELKKASPSKGVIRTDFNPSALATELVQNGASALSVLTDEPYFQGSLDYLSEVSSAVAVPLLRKDFIVDEYQVVEARAHRADAILLIMAALTDSELRTLLRTAEKQELDVLCEVHDEQELDRAVAAGCNIIGVNSRDLKTFHVDLETAVRLADKIPSSAIRVAESGIHTAEDVSRLRDAGYNAFLIGESLMRAERPGRALAELLQSRPVVR